MKVSFDFDINNIFIIKYYYEKWGYLLDNITFW